jgi:hypothetical protein
MSHSHVADTMVKIGLAIVLGALSFWIAKRPSTKPAQRRGYYALGALFVVLLAYLTVRVLAGQSV